jgi:hypothetical protein
MRAASFWLSACLAVAPAWAAEHPSLAKARVLYNAGDYEGAIAAAQDARTDRASANAAVLVSARARLERYRLRLDAADLVAAREALTSVQASALTPRDRLDHLVGFGQALYLTDAFGAAAELFDTAFSSAWLLSPRDKALLLDWWASALDREAQRLPPEPAAAVFERIASRMEIELRAEPGSAPANYWLAVAARGSGNVERAWHAAVAGWVRSVLTPESTKTLRSDLDRFVTEVLVLERVRTRPVREQPEAIAALRQEWDRVKEDWK